MKVVLFFLALTGIFFWKIWWQGLLPIPADALVGMYHPFRDYYSNKFLNGISVKNYILTDPVLQQYPWKWLAIRNWKQGKIPWENPYNFSGTPLLANIQVGVFYPLNILFFIGEFSRMWTIYIIIQPVLSALFMYLWLKGNKVSSIASLFGGLVWAFSSFNIVWLEWGNIGHAGLYLPLALLAVDKIKRKKDIVIPAKAGIYLNRFRVKHGMTALFWHGTLQFSLVSGLLAGHFQITLYFFLAVALYWFIRLGISKRSILLFTVYCLLFTAVTSPQWIPSFRFTLNSNRPVEQQDVLKREGFFISPKQLVQIIAPDFFGNPATGNYRGEWNYAEQIIYIGIIPLILAISALSLRGAKRRGNLTFFSLMLITLGLLFSVKSSIAKLPYQLKIPIWSDLQPTRLSYLITFGLSVLSAIGLENLLTSFNKSAKNMFKVIGGIGAIFLALLVISSKFDLTDKIVSQRNLIWPSFIYLIFLLLIIIRTVLPGRTVLKKRWLVLFSACCLLFTGIDLFRFGWKFTPFSAREYLYPVTPAIKFLQENMEENDKYMTLDRRILPPNANIMYEIKSIEGYDPLYSKSYAQKITAMETGDTTVPSKSFGRIVRPTNFHSPLINELNVRYLLSLDNITDQNWREVFQEGQTKIYEKID